MVIIMSYSFFMPVRIVGGEGVVGRESARLSALGSSCLVVTGGSGAKRSGALEELTAALKKERISFSVFDIIEPNPFAATCRSAGEAARECGADFIVGIGGGSALDATKAVAIFATNELLEADEIYSVDFKNPPLPTVGIGTTSGTGSEISAVSVLTDTKGVKRSIKGDFGYFDLVFADWRYTCSCPMSVTVSTALDAFMHAAEGWLGDKCNEPAAAFAAECLPKFWAYLVDFYENGELPDDEGRRVLYHASLSAGFTLNYCGTLFPHPVGYILTEHYGVPHGRACAAFFGDLVEKAEAYAPERMQSLRKLLAADNDRLIEVIGSLADCQSIEISPEKAAEHIKRWSSIPRNFTATPGGYTPEEAAKALVNLSKK